MRPFRPAAPALTRAAACAAVGFLLVTTAAPAQDAPPAAGDSAGPRAGSWATEATVGQGIGAALLRFRSPTSAWLLALTASVGTIEQELPQGGEESESRYDVAVQLGMRRYAARGTAGSTGRGVRPLIGGGVAGSFSRPQVGARIWSGGVYGELGAVYFFSPHVSLGGLGGLSLSYREVRFDGGLGESRERTSAVTLGLARLVGTVYF